MEKLNPHTDMLDRYIDIQYVVIMIKKFSDKVTADIYHGNKS